MTSANGRAAILEPYVGLESAAELTQFKKIVEDESFNLYDLDQELLDRILRWQKNVIVENTGIKRPARNIKTMDAMMQVYDNNKLRIAFEIVAALAKKSICFYIKPQTINDLIVAIADADPHLRSFSRETKRLGVMYSCQSADALKTLFEGGAFDKVWGNGSEDYLLTIAANPNAPIRSYLSSLIAVNKDPDRDLHPKFPRYANVVGFIRMDL